MIAISLAKVTLILGGHSVFRDLDWEVQHDQRIGLIGPNGAGKSSLLKLIVGEYTSESGGLITRAKGVTVGYLPQQPVLDSDQSAFEAALAGNPRVTKIEQILERIEASMSDPQVYNYPSRLAGALEEQHRLVEEYNSLGGDRYSRYVRELLIGLGLGEGEFEKPLKALSGGQKKLVGLARLLLLRPTVLLLDEPDNHLDIPGKNFLEHLIQDYPGAVVLVSHDRYLLDRVVTHIAEIEDGVLTMFQGDYSGYYLDKQEKLARTDELYRIQQREIGRLEAAIKRYAMWAKQYDNEKFAIRARAIQNRLDRMDKIDKPILNRQKMGLELEGWRGSTKVLDLRGVCKSYNRKHLLDGINLTVYHGERIGIVGPNGSGKSVLLRLILGLEPLDAGEASIGPSVKVGYYDQEHETLDFNQELIDAVRYTKEMNESNAVAFLIRYLFTYQQARMPIGELSGGERSRLQLALLVLQGANFLILDEPTNNLDIPSAEVLEDAFQDFVGTVLVVSHDRYFLDRTVERIFMLDEGHLVEYTGRYSDYASELESQRDISMRISRIGAQS